MSKPSKVLWAQGEFLAPQHFQQQDRYHEECLHQISSTLQPYLWGVRSVTWDREALKVNKLRLLALSAVFHTGDIVDTPDNDPLPAAIDLGALPSDVQDITYYAAMPGWTGGSNVAQHGGSGARTRYSQTERATADQLADGDPKPVRYLRKNVILISSLTPLGDYDCFPIIKLRRAVSGGFEQDASFIPPGLSVDSAPALLSRLTQLLEALQAKADALQGNLREPHPNVIEFRSADVASFWLLHTVSTHATALTHYLHNPGLHPERMFEALLGLTGALMTYSRKFSIADVPKYLHDDMGACFADLDTIIRTLLDTVIPAKCLSIPIQETKTCFHSGMLDSGKLDQHTTLYLAVSATMPALELVDVVPRRLKIGAPDDVEKCVMSALPGINLLHVPQVPASIPVRPDTYYFALESKGKLYEQMLKAQSITIYAPKGFDDLRLDLMAVTA